MLMEGSFGGEGETGVVCAGREWCCGREGWVGRHFELRMVAVRSGDGVFWRGWRAVPWAGGIADSQKEEDDGLIKVADRRVTMRTGRGRGQLCWIVTGFQNCSAN